MKTNKIMKWLLVFAALGIVLFVGSHLFHLGGWGQRNMAEAWQNGGLQMQAFHRVGFHKGSFGGPEGMRPFGRAHGMFGIASMIFAFILAALGWFLRKTANGSLGKKWGGTLLIVLGGLMLIRHLLPLVLLIVLVIAIWKFLIKSKKEQQTETLFADQSFDSFHPVSSKTGEMLDEWERKISKEERE